MLIRITTSLNRGCRAGLLGVALLLTLLPAQADEQRTPRQLIDKLGLEIRQLLAAPKAGRTPDDAERDAAESIAALVRSSPGHLSLTQADARGVTPLMLAINAGYLKIVQALLADPGVRLAINTPNAAGETPWMLASFAPTATLVACQPGMLTRERYVLLPPYLARMDYLLKTPGAVLGTIVRALEDAGAQPQPEAGRRAWLARCPNTSPELRDALTRDGDLLQALIGHAVSRQQAFNHAAKKAVDSLPVYPPEGMRFIPATTKAQSLRVPQQLQIQDMNCVKMPAPQFRGAIEWEGTLLLKVTASTRAGVVEAADVEMITPARKRLDDVLPYFRKRILEALAGYECEGERIFEREFQFQTR